MTRKHDISKFIKEKNNPHVDTLDTQIDKVESLVSNNIISARLANALINYLIRKDVSHLIKRNLDIMLHDHGKRDQWVMLNYNRKQTHYS